MKTKTISVVDPEAAPRLDEMGEPIVDLVTCGTCGRTWNDAIVTHSTPAPSGRCPFEWEHTEEDNRSRRSVRMHDPEEARAAAYWLEKEWGSGRRLGYAGRWTDSYGRSWAVWQCAAGDGSRWLIRSDRYGNVGSFEPSLEREIAALLDVEVSPR